MSDDLVKPVIETDPHDPSREYIPLPGSWEVQTRGRGSSYRLLDRKTGERRMIMCSDISDTHDFFTRMAKEIFAANEALNAENARLRDELHAAGQQFEQVAARSALKDTEA